MENVSYQKYVPINWKPRTTPLSAYYLSRMDKFIEYLDNIMSGFEPDADYNQILVVSSGENKMPHWTNFVEFMALYEYKGDLE